MDTQIAHLSSQKEAYLLSVLEWHEYVGDGTSANDWKA